MHCKLAMPCVLSLLLFCLSANGAGVTDFSGNWLLELAKSKGRYDSSAWIISQNEKEITITFDNHKSRSYESGTKTWNLDGKETTKDTALNIIGASIPETAYQVKITEKTRWLDGGKVLELIRTTGFSDGNRIETTRLELIDNGKTLRVTTSCKGTTSLIPMESGGDYVYARK